MQQQQIEQKKIEQQQIEQQRQMLNRTYQAFHEGSRFENLHSHKKGTVNYFRNNEYEINKRKSDPSRYYYSVNYDDGKFESYLHQSDMINIE